MISGSLGADDVKLVALQFLEVNLGWVQGLEISVRGNNSNLLQLQSAVHDLMKLLDHFQHDLTADGGVEVAGDLNQHLLGVGRELSDITVGERWKT